MTTVRTHSEVGDVFDRVLMGIAKLSHPERGLAALNYRPNPGEVCIASGYKCGTTWVQQILHGLRSGGDMSFEEIDEVIANLEFSPHGAHIDAPQPFQPNMYKTHLTYEDCPKGFSKYIVVTRNPKDAAISGYWHLRDWFFNSDEMDLNEFVDYFAASEVPEKYRFFAGMQLRHQASWYPHRKDPNVLWLHFEDLKQDLRKCIDLISDFVNIGVGDSDLLDLVEHQASFDFMKKHASKFHDLPLKRMRNAAAGLDPENATSTTPKIRNGNVGEGKIHLTQEMSDAIDARWHNLLSPFTDAKNYDEMRQNTLRELGRPFGEP